jgi:predicted amidohydrolase YtcJ
VERLRQRLDADDSPTAVTGAGLDDARLDRPPTRWDLDEVSADLPVVVHHVSGHHVVVNSVVLRERGIGPTTPDPRGGRIVRDADGTPSGQLQDAAMQLALPVAVDIHGHGPNFHTGTSLDRGVADTERARDAFLAAGVTTVCDAQVTSRELAVYREAHRQGRLPVRTVCMPLSHQLDAYRAVGLTGPFGDDMLSIGALKVYADGSLIGRTACFTEGYGPDGAWLGTMYHEPDELQDLIIEAHADGWQLGVHVQGDRAMDAVLKGLERAQQAYPRRSRHRLEHAGFPVGDQLDRICELGAVTVNQPSYLVDSGDELLAALGERAHGLQPLAAEMLAGIPVVLSSDSDVASLRPLDTIQAAVCRRTRSGQPIGPGQRLTLEQALLAHTRTAAYALHREQTIGALAPGMQADITVIDGNLETTQPDELAELEVWVTMLGGEVRYERGSG